MCLLAVGLAHSRCSINILSGGQAGGRSGFVCGQASVGLEEKGPWRVCLLQGQVQSALRLASQLRPRVGAEWHFPEIEGKIA